MANISRVASFGLFDSPKIKQSAYLPRRKVGAPLPLFKNDPFSSSTETQTPPSTTSQDPRPHRVQFASPLLEYGHPPTVEELRNGTLSEKPILLYLPGFDGTYICPFIQYPELGTEFDVWCMTVGIDDRSTFEELKWCVLDFIDNLDQVEQSMKQEEGEPSLKEEQEVIAAGSTSPNTTTSSTAGQPFWTSWFPTTATGSTILKRKKRPLYLAGESFGGLLASEVALTLLNKNKGGGGGTTSTEASSTTTPVDLQGLVLINPATCYDRSQLAAKGPAIAKLPAPLYPFGLAGLLPLFMDEHSFSQLLLILSAKALPSVIDDPVRESFMGRVAFSLPTKLEYMNQGALEWRLEEWLDVGCERLESRMRDFQDHPSFRTLILVGEKDLTLPSIAEAERLVNLLPKSQVHVVEGAGHASTCGSRMDMAAQFRKAFPELRKGRKNNKPVQQTTATNENDTKRTAMKPEAANGIGPYFGMEPRYDGANIGLNPILYWSKDNFQSMRKVDEERQVVGVVYGQNKTTVYTQTFYRL